MLLFKANRYWYHLPPKRIDGVVLITNREYAVIQNVGGWGGGGGGGHQRLTAVRFFGRCTGVCKFLSLAMAKTK